MRVKDFVKEIGGKTGNLFNLPIDIFDPNPENVRISTPDLAAHIRFLADDMKTRGYDRTEPLVFRVVDGRAQVQEGNCRLAAARLANSEGASIRTLPALPEPDGLTDQDRLARMVLANSGRHHTTAEYAIVIRKYRSWGWDDQDIAKTLQRSYAWLLNTMLLADAPEEIRDAVQAGQIAPSEAVKLVREDGDDASETLAKALGVAADQGKGRVTASTIREARQPGSGGRKNSAKSGKASDATNYPGEAAIDVSGDTEQNPAPPPSIPAIVRAMAKDDRIFKLETSIRALIDAWEGAGGDTTHQAIEDLKELINWSAPE